MQDNRDEASPVESVAVKGQYVYAFALRDPLPIPDTGWLARFCVEDCPSTEHSPLDCSGYTVNFEQATTDNVEIQMATRMLGELLFGDRGEDGEDPKLPPMTRKMTFALVLGPASRMLDERTEDEAFEFACRAARGLRQIGGSKYPPLTVEGIHPFGFQGFFGPKGKLEDVTIRLMPAFLNDRGEGMVDDGAQVSEIVALGSANDPVAVFNELALSAYNAANHEGDYIGAVLKAASAAELLIKHVGGMLVWEAVVRKGGEPAWALSQTSPLVSKPGTVVGRVLAPALGGNWSSQRSDQSIGAWRENIARKRNRVIHQGHYPSREEVYLAISSLDQLTRHVAARLKAKSHVFPRTFYLINGRPKCPRHVIAAIDAPGEGGLRESYFEWVADNTGEVWDD